MNNTLIVYHNPRCSKSRETLNLIKDKNINPKIYLYLDKPLSENLIKDLLKQMNKSPEDIIRKKEPIYKKLGLKNADQTKLIQAICKNPILLERPIVSNGEKAIIGRPPENVLSIL